VSGAYRFGFEPLFIVLALAAAAIYLRAVRAAPPGERPGHGRALVFALGLALVAIPVNSPLETLSAHYLLLAHLLQNALIADWGPPLLILGLTPGMRERLGRAGGPGFRKLTSPLVTLPLWLAVWYGVHFPTLYDWALRDGWPAGFGALAGDALLTVDAGLSGGRVVVMDPSGHTRTIVSLPGDGPNPIVEIPTNKNTRGAPAPGIYMTDDLTQDIYFIPAAELAPFAGDLFVATETMGNFWVLEPNGDGVHAIQMGNTLAHRGHGLEGAIAIT
jgi:hypothetical protein